MSSGGHLAKGVEVPNQEGLSWDEFSIPAFLGTSHLLLPRTVLRLLGGSPGGVKAAILCLHQPVHGTLFADPGCRAGHTWSELLASAKPPQIPALDVGFQGRLGSAAVQKTKSRNHNLEGWKSKN